MLGLLLWIATVGVRVWVADMPLGLLRGGEQGAVVSSANVLGLSPPGKALLLWHIV
jgi:hypothetical protein